MQCSMSNESRNPTQSEDPPYRTYRGDSPGRPAADERPYTVYRAAPRGLLARLRGEQDSELRDPGPPGGKPPRRGDGFGGGARRITPRGVLKYLAIAVVAWLLLSLVLFVVSAQIESGSIPASAQAALSSGSNMITSTDTVLVIGTDQRPKGSKEPGADTSDVGSRSDTMMLWRIGGGVSRRLSIPRDTVAAIPGYGTTKINAAYAYGGAALAIKTVEQFTGVKINHIIIVNLANFPKFINAIGGIDVTTGRICSQISGGAANGGFSLFLKPGTHHLSGTQALTLARTRENQCSAASNDLTRDAYQQKILNAIKSKLLSPTIFFRLPWASWYAPQTLRTDMGALTLLSLFAASEIGGSAPTQILKPTGSETLPDGESALVASPSDVHRAVAKLIHG
jgi:LCP family protein required for cell wall assembly